VLDHVGLLVGSLDRVRPAITALGAPPGPVDAFPAEGTREQYFGPDGASHRLLLLEPIGEGPYRRAHERRGEGLHHVAIAVPDLPGYVQGLAGSGWLLLPQSLETIAACRTAWLARPGVPCLVEVIAAGRAETAAADRVVGAIEVPMRGHPRDLMAVLDAPGLQASPDEHVWLTLGGERRRLGDLL
jgi:hypothetical protein